MKKVIRSLLYTTVIVAGGLYTSAQAENTNNALQNIADHLNNIYGDVHYIHAPKLSPSWGVGADLIYPIVNTEAPIAGTVFARLGLAWVDGGAYSVGGTVGYQVPFQPFRGLADSTNSVLYKFTIGPFVGTGTGLGISGKKFGNFTVPGKVESIDQIAAIELWGVEVNLLSLNKNWSFQLVAAEEWWSTFGYMDEVGLMVHHYSTVNGLF